MRRGTPKERLTWLRLTLALSLLAGLLLSPKLWVSTRAYPLTPIFGIVPPLPYPTDYVLFGLLGVLVVLAGISRPRWAGWFALGVLVISAFLVLQDQSRLQPWFYQYLIMGTAVGLSGLGRLSTDSALNACRMIVAFTYLWSGLQKANESFVSYAYPWLLEPLFVHLPSGVVGIVSSGAYAVPAIEAGIGLGLLTPQTRKPAAVAALLMHAFILALLSPWGRDWNTVVLPWNVAMILFVLILFWQPREEPSVLGVLWPGQSLSFNFAFKTIVLILFAILPLLSFFGLWDSYLSASLYSGNTKLGEVVSRKGARLQSTDVSDLSMQELNVPAYPEERIFKNVFAQMLCGREHPRQSILRIHGKPAILSGDRQVDAYDCDHVLARTS